MIWYGAFIFVFVYALTDMMDGSPYFWIAEAVKFLMGIGIIFYTGDWFGANTVWPYLKFILLIYFFISMTVTIYFHFKKQEEKIPSLL